MFFLRKNKIKIKKNNITSAAEQQFLQLTLSPADGIHEDVVLVDLVLVMLELSLQVLQLLFGELPRVTGLAGE